MGMSLGFPVTKGCPVDLGRRGDQAVGLPEGHTLGRGVPSPFSGLPCGGLDGENLEPGEQFRCCVQLGLT